MLQCPSGHKSAPDDNRDREHADSKSDLLPIVRVQVVEVPVGEGFAPREKSDGISDSRKSFAKAASFIKTLPPAVDTTTGAMLGRQTQKLAGESTTRRRLQAKQRQG